MAEINIIDVLVTFDVETLMELHPHPSKKPDAPRIIKFPNRVIFMTTEKEDTLSGFSGGKLALKAKPSDVIRWRETTLERNTGNQVYLYQYTATTGKSLLTSPAIQPVEVTIPIPNAKDPLHPEKFQKVADYFWQATVLDVGDVVYTFSFMVMKRDGTILGYFKWDPSITITNS
jgi:hypothetical protein